MLGLIILTARDLLAYSLFNGKYLIALWEYLQHEEELVSISYVFISYSLCSLCQGFEA